MQKIEAYIWLLAWVVVMVQAAQNHGGWLYGLDTEQLSVWAVNYDLIYTAATVGVMWLMLLTLLRIAKEILKE